MGETENGDSNGGHDDENDDDDCDGDSIVVDDDIHYGGTADVEAVWERKTERAVLPRYLTTDVQMQNMSCLFYKLGYYPGSTGKWPLSGGWQLNRGSS